MSDFIRLICGRCGGMSDNLPKSSVSTTFSTKNELKLPLAAMPSSPFSRFDILAAKDNEIVILEKSIFRILAHIHQSFFTKSGKIRKKKTKSAIRSKNALNSMSITRSKLNEDFISEVNLKFLMNAEDGFFTNSKLLKNFAEGFEICNFAVFYSGSFMIRPLKELVFFLF